MSEPTVSNVRVTAVGEPREGLPPCLSLVVFDGRTVHCIDKGACDRDHWSSSRFRVAAGHIVESREYGGHGIKVPGFPSTLSVINVKTDDPAEAQAAYERGAEWVLTGEMP